MPIPVFLTLSHIRNLLNLPVETFARKHLGIAASYLFYLEEFDRPADPGLKTRSGEPLSNQVARLFLLYSHLPLALHPPCNLEVSFLHESLYHHLWPYLRRVIGYQKRFFWKFFLPCILGGADDPNTAMGKWPVVSPQDVQTARALWWFLMRSWGGFAAGQRKRARHLGPSEQVLFKSDVETIYDVREGQTLGVLHLPFISEDDPAFDSKIRLLYYLYTVKLAYNFLPADEATCEKWREWRSYWNKPLDIMSTSRNPVWAEPPPDAPEPQLAIVFHTPFPPGCITVFFEGLWQCDLSDPVGGFYAVLGDWVTSHPVISNGDKGT